MKCDCLMIHYGELSTKGENRKSFISCLTRNCRAALKGTDCVLSGRRDHLYVELNGTSEQEAVNRLSKVAGIQRISPVYKVGKGIESLKAEAVAAMKESGKHRFKVSCHRPDKSYPLSSYDVCCALGDAVLDSVEGSEVDLHDPEVNLKVSIREDAAYLSTKTYPGLGGYPLGMAGKVTLLLSGGIDSPVACYKLLRRGIKVDCLHFAAPPYTSGQVIYKLLDILKELLPYQADFRLDVFPFTKIQEEIYKHVPEPYCITIMRRMMLRIAERVAKARGSLSIATGEDVGQVASQTLDSIYAINEVTSFPVLRPLCVEDKVDVIDLAKKINTFDISIRPYEDCCTIFKPKRPKTKPDLARCKEFEARFDFASLIEEGLQGIRTIYVSLDGVREEEPRQ